LNAWTWSPDSATLVYSRNAGQGRFDLVALSLRDGGTRTVLSAPSNVFGAQISPDGRWLAYSSNESGQFEVYVTDFPAAQMKKPVSTDGGWAPVWSRDGRELFYIAGTWMMTAAVRNDVPIAFDRPARLFDGVEFTGGATPFSVAPDGRFFFIGEAEPTDSHRNQLTLVLNWMDEMKRRLSTH
jgi:Tol biopolymer transport system component